MQLLIQVGMIHKNENVVLILNIYVFNTETQLNIVYFNISIVGLIWECAPQCGAFTNQINYVCVITNQMSFI